MKGFTAQNGVQLRITIEGESWSQGDRVSVSLESTPASVAFLALANGSEKKIKAKSEGAFEVLDSVSKNSSSLQHEFQLSPDSRITDKSGSLYVLYGAGDAVTGLAHLRLSILPHLHLRDLAEVITHHYRFTLKSTSMGKKNEVEFKFEPSGSREWASLEELILQIRMTNGSLNLEFTFHRKEINALKSTLTAQSTKQALSRSYDLASGVHDFNQRLNKEKVIDLLDSVFSEYRSHSGLFA
jgi:hypothetical protein